MMLLVNTAPLNGRGSETVNFGLEIAKGILNADVCHWTDVVDVSKYDTIGFNVFYALNLLNVLPFLKLNGIQKNTGIKLIAGGQGINRSGILDELVDSVFVGELDYAPELESPAVIKNNRAIIEIQRGCRYFCKFCQYGNYTGGDYREKDIELIKQQLSQAKKQGIKSVNFLSVNLGGYSKIGELVAACNTIGLKIRSADTTLRDFDNLKPYMKYLPKAWRFGIETFDEATRKKIGKPNFSNDKLYSLLDFMFDKINLLHMYLIYGLPGDKYSEWYLATQKIGSMLKDNTRTDTDLFGNQSVRNKVRIDYSVSTFEPEEGTPLSNAPYPNFANRSLVLNELLTNMKSAGIVNTAKDVSINSFMGKFGRGEYSYNVLMALKRGNASTGIKLFNIFNHGYNGSLPFKKEAMCL